jgi:hypothetical protein
MHLSISTENAMRRIATAPKTSDQPLITALAMEQPSPKKAPMMATKD